MEDRRDMVMRGRREGRRDGGREGKGRKSHERNGWNVTSGRCGCKCMFGIHLRDKGNGCENGGPLTYSSPLNDSDEL